MVIHLGDWIEFNHEGKTLQAEVIGLDNSVSYMNVAINISGFPNIRGTELTKSQYTIYTNVNEYDFTKDSIGKTIMWVSSSEIKKIRDGTGKVVIENSSGILPPIIKEPTKEDLEELENKKRLIKFFFKDLQTDYICTNPDSPFRYI